MGSRSAQYASSARVRYLVGSSEVVCAPMRYVKASMSTGPPPDRAFSSAQRVTAYDAMTSLPSTRTAGMPNPAPRCARGTRDCRVVGSEIANWLFWTKKTMGAWWTDAKTMASLTSPWLVAPSPK
ncbi:hypothetical protein GCM10025873_22570 [Demequina sediminis]|nr:hypothetical protein GCM10025873_22570 [Demequina sediminis]